MLKQKPCKIVQLTEKVRVCTSFPDHCIPALRCGYAGYPVNPRWSALKFHAWKTGFQWRDAVWRGEMIVRTTDSMLVPIAEAEAEADSEESPLPRLWGSPMLSTV